MRTRTTGPTDPSTQDQEAHVLAEMTNAKEDAHAKTSDLRSRIRKQGQKIEGLPSPVAMTGTAGTYEVVHGRICFGHVNGDSVYADPGAVVELSAAEAGSMLAAGTVRRVS